MTTNFIIHINAEEKGEEEKEEEEKKKKKKMMMMMMMIIIIAPNHDILPCSRLYALISKFPDESRADNWFKSRTATTAGDKPKQ